MQGRRYEIIEPVGRGGFGTVYRAKMLGASGFAKIVALKVLNADMEEVEEVASRLRDEARILGLIHHRAIVQVDGLLKLGGRWTVVMEYVEGVDVKQVLRSMRMPPGVALEIAGEIAGSLHVAYHAKGPEGNPLHLLHRDLKPSNIQITAVGEVKLLDFGIARADFGQREALTRDVTFGSVGYMAPERLDMLDGPEGDVYSLGVVLYEMLARKRFGKTSSNRSRHEMHVEETIQVLCDGLALDPKVTYEISSFLRAMLAYEPEDRPSAREVERRCGQLRAKWEGVLIRDWAEAAVPALRAAIEWPPPDELTGSVLSEIPGQAPEAAPTDAVALDPYDEATVLASDDEPLSRPPARRSRAPSSILEQRTQALTPEQLAAAAPPVVEAPPPTVASPAVGAAVGGLTGALVVVLLLGGWFFFLRDGGDRAPSPAPVAQTPPTQAAPSAPAPDPAEEAAAALKAKAAEEWKVISANANSRAPKAQAALQSFVERYAVATVADGVAVQIPEVARAEALLASMATQATGGEVIGAHDYTMVRLDPGLFTMGSAEDEEGRGEDETVHRVRIEAPFSLGRTEVPQALWSAIMPENPSFNLGERYPVESVSWLDAVKFCNALSEAEGLQPAYTIQGAQVSWDQTADGYRLPTEAEWEFAAHAGSASLYAGSDDPLAVGWYAQNAKGRPHGIAELTANAWGLYDMSGNVWEWTWDWYGPLSEEPAVSPTGPDTGEARVLRGGAFNDGAPSVRIAERHSAPPDQVGAFGIRLARTLGAAP